MTAPAIKVEDAGKWYDLGATVRTGGLLTEQLAQLLRFPARLVKRGGSGPRAKPERDGIWALRGISFELRRGEALGLVGRNGAGKSTLLKLLSRITLPTEGRLEIRGRTATLLEVGTGFHPELSGRENIFLNGAILGMRRAEVAKQFDEIVEFSGVERFLDTPVKRYSSGMFVRLGFAVAAHLDSDVLLVDEVLAVGDTDFQRKCLGKMRAAAGEGRAVVFVSHNVATVQALCSRALLIEDGRLQLDGSPQEVVDTYLARTGARASGGVSVIPDSADRIGSGQARLRRVALEDTEGERLDEVHLGEPFTVRATFEVIEPVFDVLFEIAILSSDGVKIATAQSIDFGRPTTDLKPGWHEVSAELSPPLLPHEFNVGIGMHWLTGVTVDWVERAHRLQVLNVDRSGEERYLWSDETAYVRPESFFDEPREVGPPGPEPSDELEYVPTASQPIRRARDGTRDGGGSDDPRRAAARKTQRPGTS